MTGQIHVTIYSEIFDRETAMRSEYPSTILADETLPAETFTEYELPPLPEQRGYTALCYVLLKSGAEEYLKGLDREGAEPAPIGTVMLGKTLTADDLEIVPQNLQGVYEAEIHVVWLAEKSDFKLEFYDGDELFGEYYIGFPIESEQLCYLDPFPTPTREGKTFAGWQNVDGYLVDAVTYYDFFEKLHGAKTVFDRDFEKGMPCKVYACWSDGSGGAPEPTPVPDHYLVTAIDPCGFGESSRGGSKWVTKGKYVTVIVKIPDDGPSATGYFLVTYSNGKRERYTVQSYKSVLHKTEEDDYYDLYFKLRIEVTGNMTIEFPW